MSNESGKPVNYIWDYFIKTDDSAKCSLCDKKIKMSQRSTTGLKRHLISKHCLDETSQVPALEADPSTSEDEQPNTVDVWVDVEEPKHKSAKMSNETDKRVKHVWDYFTKTGKSAICSLCNKNLKISQGSTTGLKRHLKSKHGLYVIPSQVTTLQAEPTTSEDDPLDTVDCRDEFEEVKYTSAKTSNETNKSVKQVWDYFIRTGKSAECSLCDKNLKISQGSTTGLKRHLKSKHCIDVITSQAAASKAEPLPSEDDPLNYFNLWGDFEDLKQKFSNKTDLKYIWNYFIKTGESAKCSLCNNILKISQRSITGLKYHLKSKHSIDVVTHQTAVLQAESSASQDGQVNTDDNRDDFEELKHKSVKKKHSNEVIISRLVAIDGLSFNCLSTSEDLKHLFLKSGLTLPTSPDSIKSIVENFSLTVRDEVIKKLENLKICGEKFSLTFDKWTSVKNKTYLNVNVHSSGMYFNLGLIRIHSSCSAESCVELVKTRLEAFFLHFNTDIVGMTTDDASIMRKVGRLLGCYHQLCLAHGIHLAVCDTLYNKAPGKETVSCTPQNREAPIVFYSDKFSYDDSCDDDDDETEEDNDASMKQILPFAHLVEKPAVELILNYKDLIDKIRRVVKIFKKPPIKDFLQKYVKEDLGKKDYSLILDCKNKWSSLFNMLERFNILKICTSKALIDVGLDIHFSDEEWASIEELLLCLEPVKLAVEVLCRRDSTLFTADTTLRFILEKLDQQQGRVAADLATALRKRIRERRTELSGIILYLHNPEKYEHFIQNPDKTFLFPDKNQIHLEIIKIIERLLNVNEIMDDEPHMMCARIKEEEISIDSTEVNLSLNEELEIQISKEKSDTCKVNESLNSENFEKIIKAEMNDYENRGIKGKHLSCVHNYLNTISPTSVEPERAFSVTTSINNPIRNRFGDETLNTICFLRSYFQNNNV